MKKIFIILLVSVLPFSLLAQSAFIDESDELKQYEIQQLTGEKYNDPGNKHLNIYFREYWIVGNLIMYNGDTIKEINLKYNSANDQLVLLSDKFGLIKIDSHSISEFFLNEPNVSSHFKKLKLDTLDLNKELFCQFIYGGKMDIYVYRKVKSVATHNLKDGTQRIYRPRPVYILFINNKTILINQPTQKAIYEQFPELKDQIKQKTRNFKKIKTEDEFFKFLKEIEDILVESIH